MHDYRTCSLKGKLCAEYAAYVRIGLCYYSGVCLTTYEFGNLTVPLFPSADCPKASTEYAHQVCIVSAIQSGPLG